MLLMSFQPADNLTNRTFVGLIISQFLAGFNDQAIHIAATFYAIHQGLLSESDAIFLMQILFYAPWAIFCTTSAFLADRYSKTTSIIVWKFSEIIISLILIAGFILGTVYGNQFGTVLVVACVFLMGTHAAFFSPAKYGAMPQVLQAHMLSRGNGVLESSTFLANILGLVCGGLLFELTKGQEYWIGVVLLILSVIGAGASLMMAKLPISSPDKKFDFVLPLQNAYRIVFGSRPLALAVLGIAFFVFMVSYMRATMLLHGQTHVPPWSEFHTSMIVASVALGVGLGSPLAGILSGGKIELGMVPLGCLGMILGCGVAAFFLQTEAALVASLLIIGFFSGFYMVPLYALLQHRSPKERKGEIVAFSNFMNVTGAIAATALFKGLIFLGTVTGLTPLVEQTDNVIVGITGKDMIQEGEHHHIKALTIETSEGPKRIEATRTSQLILPPRGLGEKQDVIVSQYQIRDIRYSVVRPEGRPMAAAYNNEAVPEYLFLGAAGMTTIILVLLVSKLPDFFVRMFYWMRSVGKRQLKAVGMDHLPTSGPVILATNCDHLESTMQMISATDRHVVMILAEKPDGRDGAPLLRILARRSSLVEVEPAGDWSRAKPKAVAALQAGELLGITIDGGIDDARADAFLVSLRNDIAAPVLPVWCGPIAAGKLRVVFGQPAPADANSAALRSEIVKLKEWIHANDATAGLAH
jgi:MFS family permease